MTMSDIFISYAREDRGRIENLAEVLAAQGWSVWWDRDIPFGKPFDQVIEEALTRAKCVIVAWSPRSVTRNWVLEEAAYARDKNILVPILIENVELPLGFRRFQTVNLSDWNAQQEHPEFERLILHINKSFVPSLPKDNPVKQTVEVADAKKIGSVQATANKSKYEHKILHRGAPIGFKENIILYMRDWILQRCGFLRHKILLLASSLTLLVIVIYIGVIHRDGTRTETQILEGDERRMHSKTDPVIEQHSIEEQARGQTEVKILGINSKTGGISGKILNIDRSPSGIKSKILPQ
jgi:hypothetical protein